MFLDQLARLGVINKVSTLAGPTSDDENEEEAKPEKVRLVHFQFSCLSVFVTFAETFLTNLIYAVFVCFSG